MLHVEENSSDLYQSIKEDKVVKQEMTKIPDT